jgi:linoleoyl-CoA desaturase
LKTRLSEADLASFAREIETIRHDVSRDLGEEDERYFRRLLRLQTTLEYLGRAIVFMSLLFHPYWDLAFSSSTIFMALITLGTLTLAAGKILENMEIWHNVMHGQWDWLRDPGIRASTWEWDNACPSEQWRNFHNVIHHDWTNVLGKDRDLGFGALRVHERQCWRPSRLGQPLSSAILALFFEWGLASHGVQLRLYTHGKMSRAELRRRIAQITFKGARQILKDYFCWPILAGPLFLQVCAANFAAKSPSQRLGLCHHHLRALPGERTRLSTGGSGGREPRRLVSSAGARDLQHSGQHALSPLDGESLPSDRAPPLS